MTKTNIARTLVLLPALGALGACEYDTMRTATTASRRIDTVSNLAPPIECIEINRIRETQVRDERTIDFVMTDGRVMRNRLPNTCPMLGTERRFGYRTSLSRLCNVDFITVLYSDLSQGPGCGLGRFQEVSDDGPAPAS